MSSRNLVVRKWTFISSVVLKKLNRLCLLIQILVKLHLSEVCLRYRLSLLIKLLGSYNKMNYILCKIVKHEYLQSIAQPSLAGTSADLQNIFSKLGKWLPYFSHPNLAFML